MLPENQKKKRALSSGILAWEDDPLGEQPMNRPVPLLETTPLALHIVGGAPTAKAYKTGTREFRYWAAAEALRRGADFWGALLPSETTWHTNATLKVLLDRGVDLNAYYDRHGLSFFHDTAAGKVIYSGESPDILCHELGHAVLDAIRPQLWDAMRSEVAAFHESFGDITALLAALQLSSLQKIILEETGGKLYRNSRLSRLAEQLGWALRQIRPDATDPDCLRNAVNSFYYRPPEKLSPSAPASSLSSEPHSFSRLFTGAFFEGMAGMLATLSSNPIADHLQQMSLDAGRLLVEAIPNATIVPHYYGQIAAQLLQADATLFQGKYADALRSTFVRRGILSLRAASKTFSPQKTSKQKPRPAPLPRVALSGADYGLGDRALLVHTTHSHTQNLMDTASPTPEAAAKSFVDYLFRRGRVELGAQAHGGCVGHPRVHKTHELKSDGEALVLVRRLFDCGFD